MARRRPKTGPYSGLFDPPPPGPCGKGGQCRFTVAASRKGYRNCSRCGQTAYTG